MFKWIKGKEFRKNDVIAVTLDSGHSTVVRIRDLKNKSMFIDIFDLNNEWVPVKDAIPTEQFAQEDFLKISK